jgi:hypothetical protein
MYFTSVRKRSLHMPCLDMMGRFLFYSLLVAFSFEAFDWFHRLYEADESVHAMKELAVGHLFISLVIVQGCLGSLLPLTMLGLVQIFLTAPFESWHGKRFDTIRKFIYLSSSLLILMGVLAMRWNVVIGGQLISKSLRGFTTYNMDMGGVEGWFTSLGLLLLPFLILWFLIRLFLPDDQPLSGSHPPFGTHVHQLTK